MQSIELFAGIGGISLAAECAGIETKAFCEIDPFAQKVLNKHWPNVPIFEDVKKLNKQTLHERGVDVGAIDIISGGFPCQPYSVAGKRKGKTDDRDLWPEMFRIIKEIKPTWVVGENVANFVNMELDRTLFDLESIGYTGKSFIIPACSIGAIHQRQRTFIVAYSSSKRWGSVEESKKNRCDYIAKQSFRQEREHQTNLLSDGLRKISERISGLHRNDDGISEGVDRLRGLGNAVMPQQIYPIFKAVKEVEDAQRSSKRKQCDSKITRRLHDQREEQALHCL